jgi:hypothetical protein
MSQDNVSIVLVLGIIPAFAVVFVAFWSGISFLLALLSGYRRLLPYRSDEADQGDPFLTPDSLRFGLSSYRGGLVSFTARSDGLGIEVSSLFPGHPKVRVPWHAVIREGSPTLGRGVCFLLGGRTRLVLTSADADRLSGAQAHFSAANRP